MTYGKTTIYTLTFALIYALGFLALGIGTVTAQEPLLVPPPEQDPAGVPTLEPPPPVSPADAPPELEISTETAPVDFPAVGEEQPPDLVRFAGRTVEFQLPRRWTVKEVPFRRELRLLVGPGKLPDEIGKLQRGFWLGYRRHVFTGRLRTPLEVELQQSIAQATGGAARPVGPPREITVGNYAALQQDLELPAPRPNWIRRASHVVVQTPWGVLELHGIAPVDVQDDLRAALSVVLNSLRFFEPRALRPPTLPEVIAAAPALGSWKGLQGRLHLTRDGRAEILFDRIATFRIDQDGKVTLSQPGQRLLGRFKAQGDLIFITWNDGGLLNYRWKLHRGQLLLVDHNTRSFRLQRLFDLPTEEESSR